MAQLVKRWWRFSRRNDGVEQQEVAESFRCKKGLDLIFWSNKLLASCTVGVNVFITVSSWHSFFNENCDFGRLQAPGFWLLIANQVKTRLKPRASLDSDSFNTVYTGRALDFKS